MDTQKYIHLKYNYCKSIELVLEISHTHLSAVVKIKSLVGKRSELRRGSRHKGQERGYFKQDVNFVNLLTSIFSVPGKRAQIFYVF